MYKPELLVTHEPEGWMIYTCSYPGCRWERTAAEGGSTSAEHEGLQHVASHESDMKAAEFMTVRGGIGNDAFAAVSNLVNVARAMFANEGIDLKIVEEFRLSVKRNHDSDELQGGNVLPMWDTFAEVTFPAPADDTKEDER